MLWLRLEDQWELWLGKVLGCDRDGQLAATEHKAGIEWATGNRLGSGHGCGGSGCGVDPGIVVIK